MKTVFLSAGHGGSDPGACNSSLGVKEKELNLTAMLACKNVLESNGVKVVCSRTTDEYDPVSQECEEAQAVGADVNFSIHHNSFSDPAAHGFEIFYRSGYSKSKELCEKVVEHVINTFPEIKNRGIKTNGLYFTRNTTNYSNASALVEGFFVSNKNDCDTYIPQLERFGEVYAEAILAYLNIIPSLPKKTTRYLVQVNSSDGELNCRKMASADSEIIKTYKNNDQLIITKETYGSNNSRWGYVVTDQGWVNLKYTEKIINQSVEIQSVEPIYGYEDYTNVNTKKDKAYNNGDMVFINGEITAEDGERWGYIDSDKCWINLSKTEKSQKITVQVLPGEKITGYTNYNDINSKTSNVYTDEAILIVIEKTTSDGQRWGYIEKDQCWINLTHTKQVTTTEAIINSSNNNKDNFELDENNNTVTSKDPSVNELLDMREQEEPTLSNLELVKEIIKNTCDDEQEFKYRMQIVMKEEVQSKRALANTSTSKFLVSTVSNAITDITEEDILDKLKNNKQEIVNYFKQNYNDEGWNKNINDAPETLNFWFDFMNVNNEMEKYAISAIGDRAKAVKDDKIKAIYFENVPNTIFVKENDEQDMSGYTYINLPNYLENYFTISAQGQSANDKLYSLLDQHTNLAEKVTLTSVPIYHLQPNVRVMVKDDNTKINGEYIVSKITIPLTHNGTSSITTSKIINKLY